MASSAAKEELNALARVAGAENYLEAAQPPDTDLRPSLAVFHGPEEILRRIGDIL